jgi:hypothetical protein
MPLFNKYLKRQPARTLSGTNYSAPRAKALLSDDDALATHRESNPLPEAMERQQIYDALLSSSPEVDIRRLKKKPKRTLLEEETLAFLLQLDVAREQANIEHIKLLNDIEIAVSRMVRLGQLDAREAPAKKRQALETANARRIARAAEEKKLARKKADELFDLILKNRQQSAPAARPPSNQPVMCDTPFVEGRSVQKPQDFSKPDQYGVDVRIQNVSDKSLGLIDEREEDEDESVRGIGEKLASEYAGAEAVREKLTEREAQKSSYLEAIANSIYTLVPKYTITGNQEAQQKGIKKLVERLQIQGGPLDSRRRYNTCGQRFAWQVLYDMLAPQLRKLLLKGGTVGYGWDPDDMVQEAFAVAAGRSENGDPAIWRYDSERLKGGLLSYLKVIADGKIKNALRKESPAELTSRRYLCIGKKKETVYQRSESRVGRRDTSTAVKVYFDEIPHAEGASAKSVVAQAVKRPLWVLEDGQWRQLSGAELNPNRPQDERLRFTAEYATEEFTPEPYQRFVRDETGRTVQEEVQRPTVTRKIRKRAELAVLDAGDDGTEQEEGRYLGETLDESYGRTPQTSDWEVVLERGMQQAEALGIREEEIGTSEAGVATARGAIDLREAPENEKRAFMLAVLGALALSEDPDTRDAVEMFMKNKMYEVSVRDLREERGPDGRYLYLGKSGDQISEGTVKNRINMIRDLLIVECAKALGEEVEAVAARVEAAHAKNTKSTRAANPTSGLAGLRHRLRQAHPRRSNPELSQHATDYLDSFFAD